MPIDAPQSASNPADLHVGARQLARLAQQCGPDRMAQALARFWTRVDRSGNCWEWRGHPAGYTLATPGSHRDRWRATFTPGDLAWYASRKAVPHGPVWRTCGNPACCRPKHLQIGLQPGG